MLLLTIVAFLSTIAFYRRGKQIGVSPGRAARIPFLALMIFLALSYVGAYLIVYFGGILGVRDNTLWVVAFLFDFFIVLAYLKLIQRNWQVLNQTDR